MDVLRCIPMAGDVTVTKATGRSTSDYSSGRDPFMSTGGFTSNCMSWRDATSFIQRIRIAFAENDYNIPDPVLLARYAIETHQILFFWPGMNPSSSRHAFSVSLMKRRQCLQKVELGVMVVLE